MKKLIQKIGPVLMILLTIFPILVIYQPISEQVSSLPNFEAPDWLVPIGFISIACIFVLSFLIKK